MTIVAEAPVNLVTGRSIQRVSWVDHHQHIVGPLAAIAFAARALEPVGLSELRRVVDERHRRQRGAVPALIGEGD